MIQTSLVMMYKNITTKSVQNAHNMTVLKNDSGAKRHCCDIVRVPWLASQKHR